MGTLHLTRVVPGRHVNGASTGAKQGWIRRGWAHSLDCTPKGITHGGCGIITQGVAPPPPHLSTSTHQKVQVESAQACMPYVSSSHPVVHDLQADAEVLPTGE